MIRAILQLKLPSHVTLGCFKLTVKGRYSCRNQHKTHLPILLSENNKRYNVLNKSINSKDTCSNTYANIFCII